MRTIKLFKTLLAALAFLSMMGMMVVQVKAQGGPIEAEILPSQGGADTIILLRFDTVNAGVGNVTIADIFWDDSTIALNQQGVLGADGSYNYNVTVPTEPPLSEVGNHTIRVDSSVSNYGSVSFNFTFTITEFVPSPEYLALNETYYSLLANYTSLLGNYTQLLADYGTLSANFTALSSEHSQLLSNYNGLMADYNSQVSNYGSLLANYNTLLTKYNNLDQMFSSLLTNYTSLQASFASLSSNYSFLTGDYNSLNSSYVSLESNYKAVVGQLDFTRNVSYVFITSTIVLAVATFYFAIYKKPKPASKTR